jgi:TPR repeat protein
LAHFLQKDCKQICFGAAIVGRSMDKAWADYRHGQFKERGEGRPADLPGAARLYRRAAMRGLAEAQQALAFLYATGQGVERNEQVAAGWFRRAAEQGHSIAQHNLAVMYAEGRGVRHDERQAMHWFQQAALGGSEIAREWLATVRRQLRKRIAADA